MKIQTGFVLFSKSLPHWQPPVPEGCWRIYCILMYMP